MKKIIITFIFLLGLMPLIKNGEISLFTQCAFAQNEGVGDEGFFDPQAYLEDESVYPINLGDNNDVYTALNSDFIYDEADQSNTQSWQGSCVGRNIENLEYAYHKENPNDDLFCPYSEDDIMFMGAFLDGRTITEERDNGISFATTEWLISLTFDCEPCNSNNDIWNALENGFPVLASKKIYDYQGNLITGSEHEITIEAVDEIGNYIYFDTVSGTYLKIPPSDVTRADVIMGLK